MVSVVLDRGSDTIAIQIDTVLLFLSPGGSFERNEI
jgi:hypothetical protein